MVLTDTLPSRLSYTSAPGCTYASATRIVRCELASLAANATASFTITTSVTGKGNGWIVNTAPSLELDVRPERDQQHCKRAHQVNRSVAKACGSRTQSSTPSSESAGSRLEKSVLIRPAFGPPGHHQAAREARRRSPSILRGLSSDIAPHARRAYGRARNSALEGAMRFRGLLTALVAAAALVCGIPAAADVGSGSGPPTAIGTGGAAASVESSRPRPRSASSAAAGTLWMQLSRRQQSSESPSRSRAESAAGASWSSAPPAAGSRRSTDGDGADGDAPDVALGGRRPLPFNDARYSGLSVGVPGTVETWADALENYGTMSLAEVFAPAIHVARHGYVIDQVWFDQVNANRDWFDDIPASAALFLDPDGTPRDAGTVFTNPALAKTYERIAHLGARGSTAEPSPTRSSRPFGTRSSARRRTMSGVPA